MSTKKLQLICLIFLFCSIGAFAQSLVKGTVISAEDKQPLPGVSVVVEGSSSSSITDANGSYSIRVQDNGVLRFSYVGFNTINESVNNRKTINVAMAEKVKEVDEVIVMGYSTQKKAELSSATVTISLENLKDVTTSDIGTMLQGKAAGVMVTSSTGQPGSAAEIHIRGTGSISADADPLYVVDGIPSGSFDPNDIQTITILKDAGATALFGSAAAGGVIVITTKQASKNQPVKVNFKTNMGEKEALFGNFSVMDSQELYYTQKKLYSAALFKLLRPAELLTRNFDWINTAYKPGHLQDYYLSVSGNSGKTGYFASIDHYNEDGTLINTHYKKTAARLNLNTQLSDKIDMNIRLAYTNSDDQTQSSYMTSEDAYFYMPWDSPYDSEGNLVKITSAVRPDDQKAWYSQDKRNFLQCEEYNYAKSKTNSLVADFQLNWKIFDWLTLTTSNRYNQSSYKYIQYIDPRTYNPSYSNGYLLNDINLSQGISTTDLIKFDKTFGLHSINALLGWEASTSKTEYTSASGIGMPNGVASLNACSINDISGYEIPGAGWSAFGQVQYSYSGKYIATASCRWDESSIFGPDNRLGTFPAASASWLINKEDFLADYDAISQLKLRASYGLTGNSNIGSFRYLSTYSLNSTYQDKVAATPDRLANSELGWETAYMAGLGLDISLWNRIDLNVDVYSIDNKGLLLNVPVSPSTGFFDIMKNSGSVRNQGIEFQLNSKIIKTKDFSWEMGFNIGFNKNKVIGTYEDQTFLQSSSSGIYQQVKPGQDIYSWYMPKWLGVDPANGDPLWEKLTYDANGNVTGRESTNDYTQADYQVVGKATPTYSGGWVNTVRYKGFTLSANTNFVVGDKIYNYTREVMDNDGAYLGYNMISMEKNKLGWSRWEKEGDVATHPKLVMNGNKSSNSTSSRYLEDGSYFRVKNVTLSYNLPGKWTKAVKIQNCRLFVSGDNLLTFTKFSGMDPEVSLKTSEYSLAGMYAYNYPISRQYLIGIDLAF